MLKFQSPAVEKYYRENKPELISELERACSGLDEYIVLPPEQEPCNTRIIKHEVLIPTHDFPKNKKYVGML